jgi:flagellar biosynthesis GTPase FlhF
VVLSLTVKFKNNLALADTYLDHPVSSFVFTRLDESATYGDLLDLPCLRRIPLGALCWGGGAEGELQTASPEILSQLLLPDEAATRPGGNR